MMKTIHPARREPNQDDPTNHASGDTSQFVVPFHWKRILAASVLILFVCLAAFPRYIQRDFDNGRRTDVEVVRIKTVGTIIGILTVVLISRKALRREPALVVDDAGLVHNIGPLSAPKRLRWQEIASIELNDIGHVAKLQIRLVDERAYLRKFNWLQRLQIHAVKLINGGAPIMIGDLILAAPAERILEEIVLRRTVALYRAEAT